MPEKLFSFCRENTVEPVRGISDEMGSTDSTTYTGEMYCWDKGKLPPFYVLSLS